MCHTMCHTPPTQDFHTPPWKAGETYKSMTNGVFFPQKMGRKDHKQLITRNQPVDYSETCALTSSELVDFKTAIKVRKQLLPDVIQRLFQSGVSQYEVRGACMFAITQIRISMKQRKTLIKGVCLFIHIFILFIINGTYNKSWLFVWGYFI